MTLEDVENYNFEKTDTEDAVIISFGRFSGLDEIHKLDTKLFDTIPDEVGRYDGHEIAMDDTDGALFAYGKNAEQLYKAMEPILNEFNFLNDAVVYFRFNKKDNNSRELEFKREQL